MLSLPLDLRSVQITTCSETVDSLIRCFTSLPPSLQTLKLDGLFIRCSSPAGLTLSSVSPLSDTKNDTKIDTKIDTKNDMKSETKLLRPMRSHLLQLAFSREGVGIGSCVDVSEPSLLVRALTEIVSNELVLNLQGGSVGVSQL